ncbi:MAG: hypothetical protein AB8G96_05755 [Phycisphaerales bacterium]
MHHSSTASRRPALRLAAPVLAASFLATAPAWADVEGNWVSPSEFTIFLSHMPDFDQMRMEGPGIAGLPNEGVMYCVPTSVMNLGGYIARHGHPSALPGDRNWQAPGNYNLATQALATLGSVGGTDPRTGTGLNGMRIQAEFSVPLEKFTVSTHGYSGDTFAGVPDFARWVNEGSLISLCHGWYSEVGHIDGVPILFREGGHCLTFQSAFKSLFGQGLGLRDPADGGSRLTQSTFRTNAYGWEQILAYANAGPKLFTRIEPINGDDTIYRVIDGYCKITPKMGVSFTSDNIIAVAIGEGAYDFPASNDALNPPEDATITAVAFGPDNDRIYASFEMANGDIIGACTQLTAPNWQLFEDIPLPGATQLVFGDDRSMYTIGGGEIFRLRVDVPAGQGPELIGARDVGERAVLDFDPGNARLVLLDPDASTLTFLPDHLDGDVSPISIPLDPFAGDVKMAWDHTRDRAWMTKPGSDALIQIVPVAGAGEALIVSLVAPNGITPVDIDVDDQGHLLISDGQTWHEYKLRDDGTWAAQADSFAHGLSVGQSPSISRSRTNWNPIDFPEDQWRSVLPDTFGPSVIDCAADLDGDRLVGFTDLLNLLATWGPCPAGAFCDADLDANGSVDFADLLALLAAFGECA